MSFSRRCNSSFFLRLLTNLVMAGITLTAVAHGQVTFFTPPAYSAIEGPIFVADFNGDGFPDILDSEGNLDLGNGNGTFRVGTRVAGLPLAVADFNGDGIPDILEQGTGTLLVLLGNGDGTFQAPLSTNSGAGMLTPAAAGDLNGDGKADVLGIYNGNLLVFINNGDGTFAAGVPYAATPFASLITLGDFNGDGKVDVAISSSSGTGEEIVFLGNGNGTFQAGKTSAGVLYPAFAVTGDFNNDGNLDLVISGCGTCSPVVTSILLGKGDGTFQAPTTVTSYPGFFFDGFVNSGTLAVGDVNGDGKPDLILMNGLVEIFLSNGDGTFSAGNVYHPSSLGVAAGVAAADFNSDGKLDIVAGGTVMLGNGDGTLQAWPAVAVSASANPDGGVPITVGNFNKNGAPEVAALTESAVSILANDGTGVLSLAHTYALQQQGESIVAADINGDGNLDLVIGESNPNAGNWSYSVLLGNGDGSFQPPAFYQQNVASDGTTIVIADFNGDGRPDLAFPAGSGTVAVLLGNGDGTFGAPSYFYDGGATSIVSADFNGDGKVDIAAAAESAIAVLLGNGNGTFQTAGFPIPTSGAPLLAANLTGNGYADLIPGGSSVYLSNGNGTFTQTPTQAIPLLMTADGLADINGDGILDALGNIQNGGTDVGVALGNGNGTFGPYIVVVPSFLPMSPFSFVQAADLNGGGKQDLIVVDGIDGSIFTVINTTVSVPGTNFSPASLSFPSQAVGSTSTAAPVTLSNTGAVALTVTKVTLGGANAAEFTQTNNCTTVQPMGSCTINLIFAPTTAGAASANLIVTDNAGTGSQTVSLSGTGTAAADFTFGTGSGGSSSSTISAGQTATFNLALTPAGSFSGTVNLTCSITPAVTPAPVCSVPASVSITGSSATSVTVSVATTAAGSASGGPAIILPPWVGPVGWTLALGTTLLIFVGKHRRPALSTAVMALAFIAMGGCGGSSSSTSSGGKGTPAGTYAVTVTATSGGLSHQAALTVIVQ